MTEENRYLKGLVKAIDVENRTLTAYASTGDLDRDDEVILPSAWTGTIVDFARNPVLLWAHDYRSPPVGKAQDLEVDDHGLKFVAKFATTPFADEIWTLYRDGYLAAFSVGFRAKRWENGSDDGDDEKKPRRTFLECELFEISAVPVPANPYATVERGIPVLSFKSADEIAREYGAKDDNEDVSKSVIGYSVHGDSPKAPEDHAWDGSAARARLRQWAGGDDWSPAKYRRGFVFVDGEPDQLGSYKGPHHDVINGTFSVVWRGVRAAMGSLVFGARGGRISNDGDRRGVYNHLARHYRQFDKDVLEFRDYEPEELASLYPELFPKTLEAPEASDVPPVLEELDAPTEDEMSDAILSGILTVLEGIETVLSEDEP